MNYLVRPYRPFGLLLFLTMLASCSPLLCDENVSHDLMGSNPFGFTIDLWEEGQLVAQVLSPFEALRFDLVKQPNLLKETIKAGQEEKGICLMTNPGAFSFDRATLDWLWEHFNVLSISPTSLQEFLAIQSPCSFDEEPCICLLKIKLMPDANKYWVTAVESFSRKEVHEAHSFGLLIEELRVFLKGSTPSSKDLETPLRSFIPVDAYLEQHQSISQKFSAPEQNAISLGQEDRNFLPIVLPLR